MYRKTIIVLYFFCHFLHSECQETPSYLPGYNYVKGFNAFYKVHKEGQKFSDAVTTCRGEGSELFVADTKNELDVVTKMANSTRFWIAAHDMFSEGDFVTLDGKPFTDKYVNWRQGEPNNAWNNENCVALYGEGVYLDYPCGAVEIFICKKIAVNITLNHVCESHDNNYQYSLEFDKCYKFHTEPFNWHLAFRTCRNEGSALTIINSKEEAQLLVKLFAKYPESTLEGSYEKRVIFVGFNDLLTNGIYLTTEGQTLTEAGYSNWAANQPDNNQNNEHCGSMDRDGRLHDSPCSSRAMFVCEKKLSSPLDRASNNIQSVPRLPDEVN